MFQLYGVVEGGGGPVTKPGEPKPGEGKPPEKPGAAAAGGEKEPKQLELPLQESKIFDRWKKMAGIFKG